MNELQTIDKDAIERALMDGDLSALSADQKLAHYQSVCQTIGLNPLTKPFQYITLNGKLQMYALKGATDQLRKIYKIDCEIANTETKADLYIVQVKVKDKYGRTDEDMGFAKIDGLKGDALGNAMLKAVTKAKRRATLSMCGLGMLDEDEVRTINDDKGDGWGKKKEDDLNEHIENQLKVLKPPTDKTDNPPVEEKIVAVNLPEELKEVAKDAVIKEQMKEGILVELEQMLGFNITGLLIEGVRPADIENIAKDHIQGFTNMVDLYSEKCAVWKDTLTEEAFQEVHDFCVEVKKYFMPFIGEKNEEN
tara:strand:+ start:1931 stop:2851 length:921 start_codon:yes stop_codon:yes gene_type:complete